MSLPNFSITSLSHYSNRHFSESNKEKPSYKITWIKHGHGSCFIDMERFPVYSDSVHFIPPGVPYFFETIDEMEGYMVQFDLDRLDSLEIMLARQLTSLSMSARFPTTVITDPEEMMKMECIIKMLCMEYNNVGLNKQRIVSGWISLLLVYMADLFPVTGDGINYSQSRKLMVRFNILLEKNFHLKKTVADYAEELHIAPEYLTSIIKQVSGQTTSYHIKQRILLEAKRLALHSNDSMKAIAYRLGFDEPSHFSRFFKINCGKNFRDFKRTYARSDRFVV